jgi:hypothetical protein
MPRSSMTASPRSSPISSSSPAATSGSTAASRWPRRCSRRDSSTSSGRDSSRRALAGAKALRSCRAQAAVADPQRDLSDGLSARRLPRGGLTRLRRKQKGPATQGAFLMATGDHGVLLLVPGARKLELRGRLYVGEPKPVKRRGLRGIVPTLVTIVPTSWPCEAAAVTRPAGRGVSPP